MLEVPGAWEEYFYILRCLLVVSGG